MEKEFNLSKKLIKHNNPTGFFEFEDIKEFVRLLKEKCKSLINDVYVDEAFFFEQIDKLVGDELK